MYNRTYFIILNINSQILLIKNFMINYKNIFIWIFFNYLSFFSYFPPNLIPPTSFLIILIFKIKIIDVF